MAYKENIADNASAKDLDYFEIAELLYRETLNVYSKYYYTHERVKLITKDPLRQLQLIVADGRNEQSWLIQTLLDFQTKLAENAHLFVNELSYEEDVAIIEELSSKLIDKISNMSTIGGTFFDAQSEIIDVLYYDLSQDPTRMASLREIKRATSLSERRALMAKELNGHKNIVTITLDDFNDLEAMFIAVSAVSSQHYTKQAKIKRLEITLEELKVELELNHILNGSA